MIRHHFIIAVILSLSSMWMINATASEPGLSSQDVKQWLQHRIALAHMQNDMRRNAGAYQDLPRAYAEKERAYLQNHGYSVERFRAHETRIYNAADALQQTADSAAQATPPPRSQAACENEVAEGIRGATVAPDELEQELAQMRALGLPEAQIEQIRQAQLQLRGSANDTARQTCALEAQAAKQLTDHNKAFMQASRPDWAGVEPWLGTLEQFSQWYAGNTPDAPTVD